MDVFVDPPDCDWISRTPSSMRPIDLPYIASHYTRSCTSYLPLSLSHLQLPFARLGNHAHTIHHSPAAAAVNLAGPFRWHRPAAQPAKRISRAAAQYSSAAPHRTPLLFSTPRNNNRRATEARTAWSSPHGSTGALSRVTGVCSCGRTKRPRSGTREGVALREGASERLLRSAAKYLGPRAADLGPLTSGLVGWSRPSTAASHGASTHQRPPARTKSARYHDPRASHPSREAAYSASRQLLVAFAAFTRSLARSLARLAEMAASTETLDKVLADQALPSQPSLDDTLRSWIAVPADDTSYRTGLKVSTNLHEPPRTSTSSHASHT